MPPGTVLDGELVLWRHGRVDFTALSERMTQRRRCTSLAHAFSATLMTLDPASGERVVARREPLRDRQALLEGLASSWSPPLQATSQTADRAVTQRWLADHAAARMSAS